MDKFIGLDLDGVIIDHRILKIQLAKENGVTITESQTASEIMKPLFPLEVWRGIQKKLYHDEATTLTAPVMDGAMDGLAAIKKSEVPYVLITRRHDDGLAQKLLEARGLWPEYFNEKNVFFAKEPEDKAVKCMELGVTHYVDDEMKVLKVLASVPNKILFDPLRAFDTAEYEMVNSWPELLTKIL